MKTRMTVVSLGVLLAIAIAVAAPLAAWALTPACTVISNTAHVDWTVGTVAQAGQDSNTNSFPVGVKIDVIVAHSDSGPITVSANQTGGQLSWTITNNGNATQKYAYTISAATGTDPWNNTDTYDQNNPNPTSGTIASLAAGATTTINFTSDTPATQGNGSYAVYALKAQTQWVGTSTDVTADGTVSSTTIGGAICSAITQTVDVVVGDGGSKDDAARDGASADRESYVVQAASLTITKTSSVYWDPIHGTTNPKPIPGAVVTYIVSITNATGAATASSVSMIDNLTSQVTTSTNLAWGNYATSNANRSFNDGSNDCTGSGAGYGLVVDGTCRSDAASVLGGIEAAWDMATASGKGGANTVAVAGMSIPGNNTPFVIKYQLTIQ